MTKYDEQFKLKVMQEYLVGTLEYQRVAELHDVPRKSLGTWIKLYRARGADGLRKKFIHYSAQFRLAVILRMRTDELSNGEVAALFNIRSSGCIGRSKRCYDAGGLEALMPRKRGRSKNMTVPRIQKQNRCLMQLAAPTKSWSPK